VGETPPNGCDFVIIAIERFEPLHAELLAWVLIMGTGQARYEHLSQFVKLLVRRERWCDCR